MYGVLKFGRAMDMMRSNDYDAGLEACRAIDVFWSTTRSVRCFLRSTLLQAQADSRVEFTEVSTSYGDRTSFLSTSESTKSTCSGGTDSRYEMPLRVNPETR